MLQSQPAVNSPISQQSNQQNQQGIENPFQQSSHYLGATIFPLKGSAAHINDEEVSFPLTMEWMRSFFVTGGGQEFFDGLLDPQFLIHLRESRENVFADPSEWSSNMFVEHIDRLVTKYTFSVSRPMSVSKMNNLEMIGEVTKPESVVPSALIFLKSDEQSSKGHIIAIAQSKGLMVSLFDSHHGEMRFDYSNVCVNLENKILISERTMDNNWVPRNISIRTPLDAFYSLLAHYRDSYSSFRVIYLTRGRVIPPHNF